MLICIKKLLKFMHMLLKNNMVKIYNCFEIINKQLTLKQFKKYNF